MLTLFSVAVPSFSMPDGELPVTEPPFMMNRLAVASLKMLPPKPLVVFAGDRHAIQGQRAPIQDIAAG